MDIQRQIEELLQERATIEHIRSLIPLSWDLIDIEIQRLQDSYYESSPLSSNNSHSSYGELGGYGNEYGTAFANKLSSSPNGNQLSSGSSATGGAPNSNKKRVKIPVPIDKYPEYNFVGRLLGPRGITLKTLEKNTGCKIMIRGKGSIRKDKENEVRGKQGWAHVFNEPLHIVIEADIQDVNSLKSLNKAKEAIELLLVPVPEEKDSLKKQQLRDLAVLNGTFRRVTDLAINSNHLNNETSSNNRITSNINSHYPNNKVNNLTYASVNEIPSFVPAEKDDSYMYLDNFYKERNNYIFTSYADTEFSTGDYQPGFDCQVNGNGSLLSSSTSYATIGRQYEQNVDKFRPSAQDQSLQSSGTGFLGNIGGSDFYNGAFSSFSNHLDQTDGDAFYSTASLNDNRIEQTQVL